MKKRNKQLLALMLSAILGISTLAPVSVMADNGAAASASEQSLDVENTAAEEAATGEPETTKEPETTVGQETPVTPETTEEGKTKDPEETTETTPVQGTENPVNEVVSVPNATAADPEAQAEVKTHAITTTDTMLLTGAAAAMFKVENVVVTQQEDGTYLVRMHQSRTNRNYLAITALKVDSSTDDASDAIAAATAHELDWYVGGGADGYWFTVPVATLDQPLIVCFSSEERVAAGNVFGNPTVITFDKSTMVETTESDAIASDMNILPAVKEVPVTGITLDVQTATLKAGETKTLTADVKPDDATNRTVTWSSNNTGSATVSDSGVVTAVAEGVATITATAGDQKAECTITVTPEEAVKPLTITNTTGMFNVVSASLVTVSGQTVLRFALNGTGYENLMVGTYEEANATTTIDPIDDSKWVTYTTNADGKYEFEIPVTEGQTFYPVQALSANYVKKGVYRWYSRQMVIDENALTLTAGDYDHADDVALTNHVTALTAASAKLETIGGPVSNNYKEILNLTMSDTTFDKAYVGSAADAATAENTVALTDSVFAIPVRANLTGGGLDFDHLEKTVTVSFHMADGDTWVETDMTASKTGMTVSFDVKPVPATSVELDQTALTIEKGEKATLTATISPENTTETTVTWSSDDETIAKVDTKGVITAVADGKATITAKVSDTVSATCEVTVQTTKFQFSVQPLIAKGTSQPTKDATDVVVTLTDEDGTSYEADLSSSIYTFAKLDLTKTYTLTLTREDYEIVDAEKISASEWNYTSTGLTTYTKTITGEDASSQISVYYRFVEAPLRDALRLVPQVDTVSEYFTAEALQKVKDAAEKADADEKDTAKREAMADAINEAINSLVLADGTYESTVVSSTTFAIPDFTIFSENGKMKVQITANGSAFTKLYLGSVEDAKAAADDDPNMILPDGEMVTNSAGRLAYQFTLPLEGLEKPISFAYYNGGASSAKKRVWADTLATATFKLNGLTKTSIDVIDIKLNAAEATIKTGETKTLIATVSPEDATDPTVTWESDNTEVATVENGVVKALTIGTAKITAKAGNKTATCNIEVIGHYKAGWTVIKGVKYYYLDTAGTLAKGGITIDKQNYYFDPETGAMTTGWKRISGTWYLFANDGHMLMGWQKVKSTWYYMNKEGEMLTGIQKISGKNYIFASSGKMLTGWQKVDGTWYLLANAGQMLKGWQKVNGKWYLMSSEGKMLTGMQTVSGKKYILASSGKMLTGWQKSGGKWYLLAKDGHALTGWQKVNGKWYYMYNDGTMAAKTWIGKYYVNASGVWTKSK